MVFSLSLLFWLLTLPLWGKPELQLEVTPRELKLGETLELNLNLTQIANAQGMMVEAPSLALPKLAGFEILSQQSSSSMVSSGQGLRMLIQAQYHLRPLRSGELTIPSLTFNYLENGQEQELMTQAVSIQVKGSGGVGGLIWLGGGLLLSGGIWLLWRQRRGQRPPMQAAEPVSVPVSASGLEILAERLEAGEDLLLLFEDLYTWFKDLATRRGWAPAQGATHQEILNHLRFESGLPAAKQEAITAFLNESDQLRYANRNIEATALRHLLALARQFA